VTTDHISPAGNIRASSPAGKYLIDGGVVAADFNSYGTRRGNHEIMVRGTFANIRIRNQMAPGTEGGVTLKLPEGTEMSIFDAAMAYQAEGHAAHDHRRQRVRHRIESRLGRQGHEVARRARPCSSRATSAFTAPTSWAWACLPLQFQSGESAETYGLDGTETISIDRTRRHSIAERPCPGDVARHARRTVRRPRSTCDYASTRPPRLNTSVTAAY
jgi:aconitate hydratase